MPPPIAGPAGEGTCPSVFDAKPYDLPLRTVYRWAKGAHERRKGVIVRAEIDGPARMAEIVELVGGLDPGGFWNA